MEQQFYLKSPAAIGALIRRTRRERGLDQLTLAARVGVSRQWVSEIENGKPTAELALVLRTFAALDIRIIAQTHISLTSPTSKASGD